jgi:deoxyribodipyrimidine photolyase-related protein
MTAYWILGDQLIPDHPALSEAAPDDIFLFIESRKRGGHLRYHQHKLVLLYSAMRHRAAELSRQKKRIHYHHLDASAPGDYTSALESFLAQHRPDRIRIMDPNEWEMAQTLPKLSRKLRIPIETLPNRQFMLARDSFAEWAEGKKHLLMEHHYRQQRTRFNLLLDAEGQPEGAAWNFDSNNRATFRDFQKANISPPSLPPETPDKITREVMAAVRAHFPDHPGSTENFWLPVTRRRALVWLDSFIKERLTPFGPFEDMMAQGQPTLFHSVLSPLLNIGLLTPMECVQAAQKAYRTGAAPLSSVEGFIRQIVGWREFINGIYWLKMPTYRDLNALNAERSLPSWIYTGETEMNCLRQTIQQAVTIGYNHHIQRLMVLGNFFLLGGFHPPAVLQWYMELYVDAYDWVMQPNVLGMILYADGGLFATKPYAAGSGYISKMGNYCAKCRFKPEVKSGPDACPFNYLYWNFLGTHQTRFQKNPRIAMILKTWQKKSPSDQSNIRKEAHHFLDNL